MSLSWTDIFAWTVMSGVFIVIVFFLWVQTATFRRNVKYNREAAMDADPKYWGRIRSLNILCWGLVTVEVLSGVTAIWASQVEGVPKPWWPVFLVSFVLVAIGLYVVDQIWRELMTKGIQ